MWLVGADKDPDAVRQIFRGENLYLTKEERKEKPKPFLHPNELAGAMKRGKLAEFMKRYRITARKLEELTGIADGQWRIWTTDRQKVSKSQILEIMSVLDASYRRLSDMMHMLFLVVELEQCRVWRSLWVFFSSSSLDASRPIGSLSPIRRQESQRG